MLPNPNAPYNKKLKPCSKCGYKEPRFIGDLALSYVVICTLCGHTKIISSKRTKNELIELWNKEYTDAQNKGK